MANIGVLRDLIALCRQHGILHVKFGDIELVLDPSALDTRAETQHVETAGQGMTINDFEQGIANADGGSVYDDPLLYPGGEDPVAQRREFRLEQEKLEADSVGIPNTGQ